MCDQLEYRVEILGPIAVETTAGVAEILTRIGGEGWKLEASHLIMIPGPRSPIQLPGLTAQATPGGATGMYCVFSRQGRPACQELKEGEMPHD